MGTASPAPVAVPVHGVTASARTRSAGRSEQARRVGQGADATMPRLRPNSLSSRAAPHSSRPLQAARSGDSSHGLRRFECRFATHRRTAWLKAPGTVAHSAHPVRKPRGKRQNAFVLLLAVAREFPGACFPGSGRKKTWPMESPTSGEPYARIARPFPAATTYREPRKGKRPSGGGWHRPRAAGFAASPHPGHDRCAARCAACGRGESRRAPPRASPKHATARSACACPRTGKGASSNKGAAPASVRHNAPYSSLRLKNSQARAAPPVAMTPPLTLAATAGHRPGPRFRTASRTRVHRM